MDDSRGGGSGFAISIDMRHHIVADFLLPLGRACKVDIREMLFQFPDLVFRDRKTKIPLSARQFQPQTPPGFHPFLLREKLKHLS